MKEDSATFWGHDGAESWEAVEGQLTVAGEPGTQCCGPEGTSRHGS